MINETTQTREGKSLLDIPIRDNPHVYFNENHGSTERAEEIAKHLETNPSRYYAVITPKIILCSGGEKMLKTIAYQARSIEFLVGWDCCWHNNESSALIGEEKYCPQKTVEFFNMHEFEDLEKPSTITSDKTLREIISMSYKKLNDSERKNREGIVRYLETIQ